MVREIDIHSWKRSQHYRLFRDYKQPFFAVSFELEIHSFLETIKQAQQPFFLSFLYEVMSVINHLDAFKLRIRENKVVIHDTVHASTTAMTSAGLFSFVTIPYQEHRNAFMEEGKRLLDLEKSVIDLEDEPNRDDLIFISSLPWIPFTSVEHAMPGNEFDSFPRVTWGKYVVRDGSTFIPMTVSCHHALMDGADIGEFYTLLQKHLNE